MTWPSSSRAGSWRTVAAGQDASSSPGAVPAGHFLRRVVRLAEHEVGGQDGAGVDLPTRIAHDPLDAAVGIGHFELCQQGRDLAEELETAVADVAAVPAVAQAGRPGRCRPA